MASDKEAREFIKVWQTSGSIDEIARKTGKTKRRLYSLASFYRSKGVALKKFRAAPINWKEMAELAESLE